MEKKRTARKQGVQRNTRRSAAPQGSPARTAKAPNKEKSAKKSKTRRDKNRIREIKQILLGNYITLEDGTMVSGGGGWLSPLGVGDGAGSIMVLGITDRSFEYEAGKKNSRQVMFAAFKAMKNIGRGITLETAPDAVCCYVKSVFFRPVVLVFEKTGGDNKQASFELHAYCGRSLMALPSVNRAANTFREELPPDIRQI